MTAPNFIDLTGQHFGRLYVIERGPNNSRGNARWRCLCVCGTSVLVVGVQLRSGHTTSCGCFLRDMGSRIHRVHGLYDTVEYKIFRRILERCRNPNKEHFDRYGGRGITVEWQSVEEFVRDMGPRPGPEYSIERVNNDGPYSKDNCIWATRKQQANNTKKNRRVIYQGEWLTYAQIAERTGLPAAIVRHRVLKGISLDIRITGYRPRVPSIRADQGQ